MNKEEKSFSNPENSINEIKKLKALTAKQQKMIASLKESEKRYKTIFDSANDGIILHTLDGEILDVNRSMHERLGYTKNEFMKMNLNALVSPEYGEKIRNRTDKLKQQGRAVFESADTRKDGTIMPVEVNARIVDIGGRKIIQSVVRDIQERKLAEAVIEKTLEEKESLLSEMSQSTRFNLDLCFRILDIIKRKETTQEKNKFVSDTARRLKSIDFIQNRVSRILNLSKIDIDEIVRSLIGFLHLLYRVGIRDIHIEREFEPLFLPVLKAAPVVYIINELVSNALLHAFPDGRSGKIGVEFKSEREGYYKLSVWDNGIGFPQQFDPINAESVGFWVIQNMKKELKGTMNIKNTQGAEIQIIFV